MKKSPELKPAKYDALVAAAVLLLAVALGARYWFVPTQSGTLAAVVSIDGIEVERLSLDNTERDYQNSGYTVHVVAAPGGVRVDSADCPTQDCVHTGTVNRPGQSIVCLPARIVITVVGGADVDYDVIAG